MVIEILRYMVKNIMIDKHLSTRKLFNMHPQQYQSRDCIQMQKNWTQNSEKLAFLTQICTSMCAYHGVRNITSSRNFTYLLYGSSLCWLEKGKQLQNLFLLSLNQLTINSRTMFRN